VGMVETSSPWQSPSTTTQTAIQLSRGYSPTQIARLVHPLFRRPCWRHPGFPTWLILRMNPNMFKRALTVIARGLLYTSRVPRELAAW
jgi:hypothetical protein